MEVGEVADELYGLAPGDFVPTRNERAKQARALGDKALAALIGKLPRPSTAAWAVNTLARQTPGDLDRALDLGRALREAQDNLDGAELRELGRQRRALVAELVDRARAEAREAGHPISDPIAEEVEQTLRAAMADEQAADAVRSRRLTTSLTSAGRGRLAAAAGTPAQAPGDATVGPSPSSADAGAATAAKSGQVARATRLRDEARTKAEELEREAAAAENDLLAQQGRVGEAEDRREDLRTTIGDLEEQLRRATAGLSTTDRELAAQRRAVDAMGRAAAAARKAADRARDRLDALLTPG